MGVSRVVFRLSKLIGSACTVTVVPSATNDPSLLDFDLIRRKCDLLLALKITRIPAAKILECGTM